MDTELAPSVRSRPQQPTPSSSSSSSSLSTSNSVSRPLVHQGQYGQQQQQLDGLPQRPFHVGAGTPLALSHPGAPYWASLTAHVAAALLFLFVDIARVLFAHSTTYLTTDRTLANKGLLESWLPALVPFVIGTAPAEAVAASTQELIRYATSRENTLNCTFLQIYGD